MSELPPNREQKPDDEGIRRETMARSRGRPAGGIAAELLALLRCPKTQQTLTPAAPEVVAQLEAARATGRLRDGAGRVVQGPVEGGLVRADGTLFFPIRDGIPVLLTEEAVALPLVVTEK